jgi:hypothetical protein
MPSFGPILDESPSLDQAHARSLFLVDPLCRNKRCQTVIREFFRPSMRLMPHSLPASTAPLDALSQENTIQHP